MKTAVISLAVLLLLAGCATNPSAYPPTATAPTTYVTTGTTYVPTTNYVPTTVYVPSASYAPTPTYIVPNTTYVPSASPAYYTTMDECRRAGGIWYAATSVCDLRR